MELGSKEKHSKAARSRSESNRSVLSVHPDELSVTEKKCNDDANKLQSRNWVKDARLSLSVLLESQNATYGALLRQFSDLEPLSTKSLTWENLLSVDNVREDLNCAIFETDLLEELCNYLDQIDCEKVRLALQHERLMEENEWLTKEQAILQERLLQLNKTLGEVEAHRDVEQFIYRMRRGDCNSMEIKSRLIERELEEDGYIAALVSPKMRGIYHLCVKYIVEGRLDVAVAMCTQLLRDRDRSSELDVLDYGVINLLLGIVLSQQKRYTAALTNMDDALKTFEMSVGKDHPSLGCVLTQLAEGNIELGDYEEAKNYLQRAIDLKRNILGEQHDDVIKLQVDLMETLLHLDENEQVIQLSQTVSKKLMFTYSKHDSLFIRAQTIAIRAHIKGNQMEVAFKLLKVLFNECFPRTEKQTIITLIERANQGTSIDRNEAFELYGKLNNPQEIELLNLLQTVYRALGKDEASELVASILKTIKT
ncbi:Kinesin light chain [Fasciolopsis buskii]|uniref:Kinesin light chain n=1 Tax=Fasciolopsis buskii TaxID=27845 RepID=A0A8E0VEY8_9TREM|nr:Kinesin light chain [Fasciolopsis buski]